MIVILSLVQDETLQTVKVTIFMRVVLVNVRRLPYYDLFLNLSLRIMSWSNKIIRVVCLFYLCSLKFPYILSFYIIRLIPHSSKLVNNLNRNYVKLTLKYLK